ncbi:MAG: ATP-binding protein [Mariprofundaceae bacterium]
MNNAGDKQSAAEFLVLEALPVGVLMVNDQGHMTYANELAQEYLGKSFQRLTGQCLANFLQPSSEVKVMLQRALLGEVVSDDAFFGRHNHMPYTLRFAPIVKLNGVMVVLTPEAHRSELEEYSKRHEMAEAISRIALEMAHEVKNPLASLRGAAQLLCEQSSGDAAEISQHMLAEVDRIKDRIDTFLQVGPRANVAMTKVNIHALLDDVCQVSTEMKVKRVYDPSLPLLWLHEARLRQAIENLWVNALEAGSSLVIWETRIAPLISLPNHKGMVVEISVCSNGKLIPASIRQRLFEPYVSDKARGSGLGLAIVQRVIQEHGGRVSLKTELGDTQFLIHLPIHKENKVCGH